jgi:hypothetical protein
VVFWDALGRSRFLDERRQRPRAGLAIPFGHDQAHAMHPLDGVDETPPPIGHQRSPPSPAIQAVDPGLLFQGRHKQPDA